MKKLLILFILILLKCTVYGQLGLMDLNLNNYKTSNVISEYWKNGNWENELYSSINRTNTGMTRSSKIWNPIKNIWVNYVQSNVISTTDGYIQDVTSQKWDTLIDAWQNDLRVSFIYNNSNDVISFIGEQWLIGSWKVVEQDKYEYTYDITGKRSLYQQRWDTITNIWVNYDKRDYLNDTQKLVLEEQHQTWNKNSNSWEYYYKGVNTYNSNQKLKISKGQDYSFPSGWSDLGQTNYSYDSNGDLINELILTWTNEINSSVKILKNSFQDNYINNTDGTVFQHTSQSWDVYKNIWNNFYRDTYDYPTITDNKKQIDNVNFKIYPNPTSGIFTINSHFENTASLNLIDILGKQVLNNYQINIGFNQIDVSELSKGVYFIQLTSEGVNHIERLVIN